LNRNAVAKRETSGDTAGQAQRVADTPWRRFIGLEEGSFDAGLRAHRRRLLDRAGVLLAGVGFMFVLIAVLGGDVGNLQAGDWIGAGSVLVAAGGLFLSLGSDS
jgi:hypothetical protein